MTEKAKRNPAADVPGQEGQTHDPSRRNFLNTAGCAVLGGLAVAAGAGLLSGKTAGAAEQAEAPPLPWKYTKLDPTEAGKRGYENYLLQGG